MPNRTAKKATPTKGKKASGNRYNYSQLAGVALTGNESHNIYGSIVDATFPYKVTKDRFICSLKVVDPSLNGAGKKEEWASIVLYASRFEDLPIVHRLGDIIRVHRATLRLYDDRRQFNVNVQHNGSWAVFSTDNAARAGDSQAMSHSGKRMSFEKHEVAMLAGLRKWSSNYFAAHNACAGGKNCTIAKAKSASGDFDVCAKITQIHEFDEYTNELRLRDNSGSDCYTLATKLKFPHLRTGMAVYIRSVSHDESSSKAMLAQSHFSNIMSFINGSRCAGGMAKVASDGKADAGHLKNKTHAVVVSEVGAKYANLANTSLRDLFHRADTLTGNTFRVHLQVLAVQPGSTCDMVKVYNASTHKSSSAKGVKAGNFAWETQLLCKDASTANGGNQYRILNYSHDGLGANFFGKAQSLHDNRAAHDKVDASISNLTRFNSWLDAIVERRNGFYVIRDTRLIH